MVQMIRSLLLLLTISCCVGGLYLFFTDGGYWDFLKGFILAISVQLLFFFAYNNLLRYIARLKLTTEALKLAQLAEKNKILIECQGCKETNSVDIDLTTENNFTCIHCNAENKINIEFTTVLPTNIIYDK